jgi:hypothetical protein
MIHTAECKSNVGMGTLPCNCEPLTQILVTERQYKLLCNMVQEQVDTFDFIGAGSATEWRELQNALERKQ